MSDQAKVNAQNHEIPSCFGPFRSDPIQRPSCATMKPFQLLPPSSATGPELWDPVPIALPSSVMSETQQPTRLHLSAVRPASCDWHHANDFQGAEFPTTQNAYIAAENRVKDRIDLERTLQSLQASLFAGGPNGFDRFCEVLRDEFFRGRAHVSYMKTPWKYICEVKGEKCRKFTCAEVNEQSGEAVRQRMRARLLSFVAD